MYTVTWTFRVRQADNVRDRETGREREREREREKDREKDREAEREIEEITLLPGDFSLKPME